MSERSELTENEKISEAEKIDIVNVISDFLYGIKRLWFLIIILIVGFAAYSYFSTSVSYVPQYVASATMTVTTPTGGGGYIDANSAAQMAEVFPYILESGALQEVVAQEMGVDAIQGSINVTAEEGTNLLTISVTSGNAQMAYDTLQQVIESYPQVAEFVLGETKLEVRKIHKSRQ